MSGDSRSGLGAFEISRAINESLRQYIEAHYHVKNESIIRERSVLLNTPGVISQRAYVESTPIYQSGKRFQDLDLPGEVRALLSAAAQYKVGIVDPPYLHQASALEAFFKRERDLIVATGTGSGKTESFLMPIAAQLLLESLSRPKSSKARGCRALLLYPMNALVNDQLSRIRKLFGNMELASILSRNRNRTIQFASYTGRTPYPGPRTGARDSKFVMPLFQEYYLRLLRHPDRVADLRRIGRWPSKDLASFYAADQTENIIVKTGKRKGMPMLRQHWDRRLHTQEGDAELMLRHEVQETCPDILITNYSMLEYMLMRPIERTIFNQTRQWLESDKSNEFIVVLDEAHMYTGSAGAEVALLLRRLGVRLGLSRERMRFILTSASMGEAESAKENIIHLANELTGIEDKSSRRFEVITGELEERPLPRPANGDGAGAVALAKVDLVAFEEISIQLEPAGATLIALALELGWPTPDVTSKESMANYLFENLTGFEPAETLISQIVGVPSELIGLGRTIFPNATTDVAQSALSALLALCTFACRASDGRILLPTRLHLFHRALPGLFACSSKECDARFSASQGDEILGRLHTEPKLACDCRTQSRVYELLTHRDCGAAFLQGYVTGVDGDFVWSEPSGRVGRGDISNLIPVQLLVDGSPHPDAEADCRVRWLDTRTGRLASTTPPDTNGFRKLYMPGSNHNNSALGLAFSTCPVCLRRSINNEQSKIMDHVTKGEAPFAHMVTTALSRQPDVREESRQFPNAGRKVLLFSDGRQKAARLARDIPRVVQKDVFRQAICIAAHQLEAENIEARPSKELYVALLALLSREKLTLFDGSQAAELERDISAFEKEFENDLHGAIQDCPVDEPPRYHQAILEMICGTYYTLFDTTVGYIVPTRRAHQKIFETAKLKQIKIAEEDLQALEIAWIQAALTDYAFNARLNTTTRAMAAGYWRRQWGTDGKFTKELRMALSLKLGIPAEVVGELESTFASYLADKDPQGGLFVEPLKVKVHVDLSHHWFQCLRCTWLWPASFQNHCLTCGANELNVLDPADSMYLRARKGFWRNPVLRSMSGIGGLTNINVEEHTAQLSHRDAAEVYATTELFELRFQDILIEPEDRPIDMLSCTTTMEVGVDIGALVAIGLRNVPPQRSNYQQRAGRAGRRGSSISTVVTFAQNGPHDNYYFHNPSSMIAGQPRSPEVKTDNRKIVRRHINAFLFQTFFGEAIDAGVLSNHSTSSVLQSALGGTSDFFHGLPGSQLSLEAFNHWVNRRLIEKGGDLQDSIAEWVPRALEPIPSKRRLWAIDVAIELLSTLHDLKAEAPIATLSDAQIEAAEDDSLDATRQKQASAPPLLLDFLFAHGLLPSYAFPTSLASFLIEEEKPTPSGWIDVRVKEMPTQARDKALSEYAPGRLIVINKETYRSAGVSANCSSREVDRAVMLFAKARMLYYCERCNFVAEPDIREESRMTTCPVCNGALRRESTIEPEVFHPEHGRPLAEDDREQDITYASMAQLPVPVGGESLPPPVRLGTNANYTYAQDRKLITVNKGRSSPTGFTGFLVCSKCGSSTLGDQHPQAKHDRPYFIGGFKRAGVQPCSGGYERVYLGHTDLTDLLLVRFVLHNPIIHSTSDSLALRVLEDSLYTLSQGLLIAASRHPQLDINPQQFGCGFRIIPSTDSDELQTDIYLYDTASGGAGYSELAGQFLPSIVRDLEELLVTCPSNCDMSCNDCLRHYYNQHIKDRLDRKLGVSLLKYALTGERPPTLSFDQQVRRLGPLKRLLDLDTFECAMREQSGRPGTALTVSNGQRIIALGVYPGLLDGSTIANEETIDERSTETVMMNEFLLERNLPEAHQRIRQRLGSGRPYCDSAPSQNDIEPELGRRIVLDDGTDGIIIKVSRHGKLFRLVIDLGDGIYTPRIFNPLEMKVT